MKNRIVILRKRVNRLDRRILRLLLKRYMVVSEIGYHKKINKLSVVDRKREDEILKRIRDKIGDDKVYNYAEKIYRAIFEASYEAETSGGV